MSDGETAVSTTALLRALAARGAYAETDPASPGCTVLVYAARNGFSGAVARFETSALESALEAGHCIRAAEGERVLISRSGRDVVRRSLSAAGAPPVVTVAATEPAEPAPAARPKIDDFESPLAWLRRRKGKDGAGMISAIQFDAGERLRADYTFALLMPSVTSRWSALGGAGGGSRSPAGAGVELRDNVLAARERVQRALQAVGPELSSILVDVCCHLKGLEQAERAEGWPLRSAKVVLQLALNALARHYGIATGPAQSRPASIVHWGADDYRPAIARMADPPV